MNRPFPQRNTNLRVLAMKPTVDHTESLQDKEDLVIRLDGPARTLGSGQILYFSNKDHSFILGLARFFEKALLHGGRWCDSGVVEQVDKGIESPKVGRNRLLNQSKCRWIEH